MRRLSHLGLAAALAVALAIPAMAQRGPRQRAGNYNPATETTLTGTVEQVQPTTAPGRGMGGLHLVLRTDAGTTDVHVGPAAYIQSKGFEFAKGDRVSVTGSEVTIDGQRVLLARDIVKGDETLQLRDAKGFPLWSGRARR